MITTSIDVSGMETVLRQISLMTMRPMREVTLSEAKSILQTCLDRTKLTPAEKIRQVTATKFNQYDALNRWGVESVGSFPKISVCSKNGRVWLGMPRPRTGAFSRTRGRRGGGVWYLANKNYLPDSVWDTYLDLNRQRLSSLKNRVTELLSRRGIPKFTWHAIAQEFGENLRASAAVLNSKIRNRMPSELGKAKIKQTESSYSLTMTNSSIASMRKDAEGILQRTVQGRQQYFKKNLEKGVFDSMKNVERAYPNLVKVRAA